MYKQIEIQKQIAHAEELLSFLRGQLNELDSTAKDAYNDTQRDSHNLHTQAWSELTEEKRNEWRAKVYAMNLK